MKSTIVSTDYTVIIGCGRLGAGIANSLSDKGQDVLVTDCNPGAFRKLSPAFGGLTKVGDATDTNVLMALDICKASAVIIVTDNDYINIMVAQLIKVLAPKAPVIIRLYNPDYRCVYAQQGIDTVCPSLLCAREIDGLLSANEKGAALL